MLRYICIHWTLKSPGHQIVLIEVFRIMKDEGRKWILILQILSLGPLLLCHSNLMAFLHQYATRDGYVSEDNIDPRHEAKFSDAIRRASFHRLVAAANR
jgi:hypothetical protein